MPLQYTGTVSRVEPLGPDTFLLTADLGQIALQAAPGQFVHIRCGEGNLLRRPISICDVSGTELTVVFEVKGSGTQWLSQRKRGDPLDVLGPLGHGFACRGSRLIVIGGGIGVPPMLYTAKAFAGKAEITAGLGFRSQDRILLAREFASVGQKVIVATDDGSNGVQGPVTLPLETLFRDGAYDDVLCCGPGPCSGRGGTVREICHCLPGFHGAANGRRHRRMSGLLLRHKKRRTGAYEPGL